MAKEKGGKLLGVSEKITGF